MPRAPKSLGDRLALWYALALGFALVAFAAFVLIVLDRVLTSSLDQRLFATARAVTAVVDGTSATLGTNERHNFARIVGPQLGGAIYARGGTALASTVVDVPDAIEALADAPSHAAGAVKLGGDAESRVRAFATAVPRRGRTPLTLILWAPSAIVDESERRVALAFAFAIPVTLVLALVAGRAIARRGLQPLRAIATLAADIEAHDLARRLALPLRDDELGALCATFDRMLDRIEAAFARERRFSEDASHELRAPLAILRAEAELALARTRSTDEYRRVLASVIVEADRLERLTRDLLASARAHDRRQRPAPQRVDLAKVAASAAAHLDVVATTRGVTIVRELADDAVVEGDPEALARVAVALLDNALKYAAAGKIVEITVTVDANGTRLCVADRGPGFSPEALAHATERFWRQREPSDALGTGLGLAIVRELVERCGGKLALDNRPEGGALVSAAFPRDQRTGSGSFATMTPETSASAEIA